MDADEVPPTYEAATSRDPLGLIAPYVRRQDLFAAALVSRRWSAAFAPRIWERPDRLWVFGDGPVLG